MKARGKSTQLGPAHAGTCLGEEWARCLRGLEPTQEPWHNYYHAGGLKLLNSRDSQSSLAAGYFHLDGGPLSR